MPNVLGFLQNKRLAILGFGLEGQSVARFLQKHHLPFSVLDQKNAKQLELFLMPFSLPANQLFLGKDYLRDDPSQFDLVFRSPGLHPETPFLKKFRRQGGQVESETSLFLKLCPAKIIAITGTKGKGTTATLLYQILQASHKDVFLAGNIGTPKLDLLPRLKKSSRVILELSSFQLADLRLAPHLTAVLAITPDHLDYHASLSEYHQAKANLVKFQKKPASAVFNYDDPVSRSFAKLTKAQIFFVSLSKKIKGIYLNKDQELILSLDREISLGKVSRLKIPGRHNWTNVAFAALLAKLVGSPDKIIQKKIFNYRGYSQRLEPIATLKGVDYYNDSASTTPESLLAAIKAFPKPIILIAGGSHKNVSFQKVSQQVGKTSLKTAILIGQTAPEIKKALQKGLFKGPIFAAKTMTQAVKRAARLAGSGDVVLLSPGCASFDMFVNYQERGRQFNQAVKDLK